MNASREVGLMNETGSRVIYEFNGFRADPVKRRLYSGSDHLPLTPKAFDTLLVLIRNRGELVSKNDLMDAVWPETAVEENNLTQQIAALRRCFREKAGDHRFIVTLPGKGYSFIAPVLESSFDSSEELSMFESTRSTVTIDIEGGLLVFLKRLFRRSGALGASVAAVYIFVVCFAGFWPVFSSHQSAGRIQTVAVLGFRSFDHDTAELGSGLRDTLRARIGNLEDVELRPARFMEPPENIVIAGREECADVVLTGSVQQSDDRVRVALEMVDVKRERVVWGQTFDYSGPNRFEVQDAIAGEVLKILGRPPFRKA